MDVEQTDFRKYFKTSDGQGIDGNTGYKISHKHSINVPTVLQLTPFARLRACVGPCAVNSAKRDIIPNPLVQVVQNDLCENFRDTNL